MQANTFLAMLTIAGEEALANAALSATPVGFSVMAVGDGNGVQPVITPAHTGLVNERYRAPTKSPGNSRSRGKCDPGGNDHSSADWWVLDT